MDRLELSRRLGGGPPAYPAAESRLLVEADPRRFQAAFAEAAAGGGAVLLGDPGWGATECAERDAIVHALRNAPTPPALAGRGWLGIPTGGTGGRVRFARHDESTLSAAVDGFVRHFGASRVSAVGLLPLHHVSGLMAWLRCALTGGRYVPASWTDVEAGRYPEVPYGDAFLSLVPTQLQRLLGRRGAADWLRRFRAVFLGGGPAWPDLLERAAEARLPLAPSYGMTETAAMVAALTPEEFAAGRRTCGRPLPHARISKGGDGRLRVGGASVYLGYFPEFSDAGIVETADTGVLGADGHLSEVARADEVIISGGEKVDPAAVEAVLRATGAFPDVAVLGVPHASWGMEVVALYPSGEAPLDLTPVQEAVRRQLAPARRPKRYIPVSPWPRNAQGKLNRSQLRAAAAANPAPG